MKMVRNREEVDPEAKVLEQVVGDNILYEAILEPRRESLRARRRRAAYAEFVDDLATVMAPMIQILMTIDIQLYSIA